MNREDIAELYFIAPIDNVSSILGHGILCHKLAERINHHSVAMQEIQERRENKKIPGARRLHEYANLYLDAHNPMLSKCRSRNDEICILQVDTNILDLPGVIIADQNAASKLVRFSPVAEGLERIDRDRLFARYWTHPQDYFDEKRHKSEKCAEVLVPNRVAVQFIIGAYVANETALSRFQQLNLALPVCIKRDIFF